MQIHYIVILCANSAGPDEKSAVTIKAENSSIREKSNVMNRTIAYRDILVVCGNNVSPRDIDLRKIVQRNAVWYHRNTFVFYFKLHHILQYV